MRQIDNYTDKEREILALKGMTAPKTVFTHGTDAEANIPGLPNKAQPQHSPEPWGAKDSEREMLRLNNRLIEVEAHAEKLAGCLERCRDLVIGYRKAYCTSFSDDADAAIKDAYQVLQDFGIPNAQKGGQQ